jgi:hypothetical protein
VSPACQHQPQFQYQQKVNVVPVASLGRPLRLGDVIAVKSPEEGFSLKRILGFQYDKIEIKNNFVFVNGIDLSKNRLSSEVCNKAVSEIYGEKNEFSGSHVECYFEVSGSNRY